MSSFYGLNKCVQYASLIEIPAAVVQISMDRLQLLLKTSSNDMASLCKLTEPERNGLAHLVSPNFKYSSVPNTRAGGNKRAGGKILEKH